MRLLPLAACLALFTGCATFDQAADGGTLHPPDAPTARGPVAHGPAVRGPDGWVVTVTPSELAALGLGQQMELDVQAPDIVYVIDYQRLEQLDAVFARTAFGLFPLRALLTDENDAGRVVLRTRRKPTPASQPAAPTPSSEPG